MNNRQTVLLITFLSVPIFLSGCLATTQVQHSTASGRPEVTIVRKAAKSVLADISNEMVNLSYAPRARSEMTAVFEKDLDRAEQLLLGSTGGNKPVRRVTYDIIESDTSTRVLATLAIVSDPGGRNEKATPVNDSKESLQWQALLDKVKAKYNRK